MLNKSLNELNSIFNEFHENGYIIVDDVFPKEDLMAFKKTLETAVNIILNKLKIHKKISEKNYSYDEAMQEVKKIDQINISMIQMTISRSPEYFKLTSNSKMTNIIKMLFGLSSDGLIYEISNGVVFTMPNDQNNKHDSNMDLFWHKDIFYTAPRSKFLQIWAPLIHDSTEEIGTLQVCPKSHKDEFAKQRFNPNVGFNHRYTIDPIEIEKYEQKSIELKLGQLLIFDGKLIHGSGKNSTNLVRTSMLGLCHDASNENFLPTAVEYKYLKQTPEAYFYEVYKDENIKSLINEQAAFPEHFT